MTEEDRPLQVAAFTGGLAVPSARFRLRQYVGALGNMGISVSEHWAGLGSYPPRRRWVRPGWLLATLVQRLPQLAEGWTADVTLIQREMVSTLATLERYTRRPRIFDVDDAIHLFRQGRTARRLAAQVDLVVAGNPWLAEVWRRWCPAVEILPTAVDTDLLTPQPWPERPVIGWIGSSSGLPYLEGLGDALRIVLRRFPAASIMVCCDRPPNLGGLPVTFLPWSTEAERRFFASLSIGLMPLDDTPWERGKCSFKMLQYMAAGRPSVVSPIGMNAEILGAADVGMAAREPAQWVEALSNLLATPALATAMGSRGRHEALARYSIPVVVPRLAAIIRALA
jgi:glycosyltransferase involved in cell wall biosynthesis